MDIEQITHLSYKKSLWVAIVLSGLAVAVAALLGRSTLNMNASVGFDYFSDATAIAVLYKEQKLEDGEPPFIVSLNHLRSTDVEGSNYQKHAYLVLLSNGEKYMAEYVRDEEAHQWVTSIYDLMHGEQDVRIDTESPKAETAP